MKFYSRIVRKPNSIIEQVRDGLKIVSTKRLCVFINGELETNDQNVIDKLKAKPNLFRTDRPWKQKIKEKEKVKEEEKEVKKDIGLPTDYKALVKLAKEKGIKAVGVKKSVLIRKLGKEV